MILVDTSVWIDHLRNGNARMRSLLNHGQVLSHPCVIGELACGKLQNRSQILSLLDALPAAPVARQEELLQLIEAADLYGCGLGWTDVHILASALIARCSLWALDRPLARAATALKIPGG